MKCKVFSIAACLLFFGGPASGATVERLSWSQLVERSAIVFVGEVAQQRTTADRAPVRVWTHTDFDVLRGLKGDVGDRLELSQLGGALGHGSDRLVQKIHGYPSFSVGEKVLLFLERTSTGRLVVTGLAQGKFRLSDQGDLPEWTATRDLKDVRFAGASQHVVDVLGVPSDQRAITVRQVAALVEGRRPTPKAVRIFKVRPVATPNSSGVMQP